MSRMAWYVLFSLVVAYALSAVGLPAAVVAGYLLIAVVGLATVVRDTRAAARASRAAFAQDMFAARDRMVERVTAARQAAEKFPWYREVDAAQASALARGASTGGLFTSYNPIWSLPLDGLVRYGIATEAEVLETMRVASESPPASWLNGFMLSDLAAAGYSELEAITKIGSYTEFEGKAARIASATSTPGLADD